MTKIKSETNIQTNTRSKWIEKERKMYQKTSTKKETKVKKKE